MTAARTTTTGPTTPRAVPAPETRAATTLVALGALVTAATGLVAGTHVGGLPLADALRTLDGETYTAAKQALDVTYPLLMKPLLLTTLALAVATTVTAVVARRRGGAAAAGLTLAAGAVVLFAILRGDQPLNLQVDAWDPAAPPAGWEAVRAQWESWFHVRTAASCLAFAAALATLASAVRTRRRRP